MFWEVVSVPAGDMAVWRRQVCEGWRTLRHCRHCQHCQHSQLISLSSAATGRPPAEGWPTAPLSHRHTQSDLWPLLHLQEVTRQERLGGGQRARQTHLPHLAAVWLVTGLSSGLGRHHPVPHHHLSAGKVPDVRPRQFKGAAISRCRLEMLYNSVSPCGHPAVC